MVRNKNRETKCECEIETYNNKIQEIDAGDTWKKMQEETMYNKQFCGLPQGSILCPPMTHGSICTVNGEPGLNYMMGCDCLEETLFVLNNLWFATRIHPGSM